MSTQNQATDTSQPQILPSFVKGEWWRPEDPQKVADVRNAATGELVARVSTDGIDTAGAVEYARTVGQASLGTLRIHDRALILKQLAQYLGEHKEELYEISYATGATAKDHLIDIDGGIGTLFTFSSKGRRELPNANVIRTVPWSSSPGTARSWASTCTRGCPVWPCRSTRSTSPCGACSRSSRPRSSRECPPS